MKDIGDVRGVTDRRSFLASAGAAAAVGALSGCLGGDGGDGTITIGGIQPLSGTFAPWGQAHERGVEFALEEVNENGGILDREVEYTSVDTESDPGEASSSFRQFVEEDGAVAVTGPVSSDVGVQTASVAEDIEVPLFLDMAGSDAILSRDSRFTFRMTDPPPQMQVPRIYELIQDRGYSSVGAIIADYEWGRTVQNSLEAEQPGGVDVTIEVAPLGESDFTPFLRQMPDDMEAMITLGAPPHAVPIVGQQFELEMQPDIYALGGGWAPAALWFQAVGDATFGGNVLESATLSPEHENFVTVAQRFNDQTGERFSANNGYGYATVKLIKNAIEEADSTDPADIAQGTRDTTLDEIYVHPLDHTEWGELANQSMVFLGFESGAPEYYPDGEWRITEEFVSEPMEPYEPPE